LKPFSLVNSDYLSVTSHEGDRFYVRMKTEAENEELDLKSSIRSARPTGLCGVPFADLLEQATLESSKMLQVIVFTIFKF
jgi:hypothetical protein